MDKLKLFTLLCGILIIVVLLSMPVEAQVQDRRWSEPYRLSGEVGSVTFPGVMLTADPYGYVHAFWGESGFGDRRTNIQYARFDGQVWSIPVDIYVTPPQGVFGFIGRPVVDKNGILHLAWTGSQSGPIRYMRAPVAQAGSAHAWSAPVAIQVPAYQVALQVDSRGTIHVVYANSSGVEPGVYYLRSTDGGENWSQPVWLDPDIPVSYFSNHVFLELDPVTDGLHVLWRYDDAVGDQYLTQEIRYAHSLDGGETWSTPFIVDRADEEPDELRATNMGVAFAAYNHMVHVVWAGTSHTYREHRFSTDSGTTWSNPSRVFGQLHGAAGDSLLYDTDGRFYFLGQVRWPQGIYKIVWDGQRWQEPSLIYLVARTAFEDLVAIHVHNVQTTLLSGSQLVVTFTNSPGESSLVAYAMHGTLEDMDPIPAQPMPSPTPTPTPIPQDRVVSDIIEPMPTLVTGVEQETDADASPGMPLLIGMIPALLLVGFVLAMNLFKQRR